MMTLEEQLRRQMSAQDLGGTVMWTLGLIATLLTLLGAYVLAESTTSARARELSIRRAIGASRLTLGGLVVTETLRLVGLGIIVGLGLAWLGAETIRSLLYRIDPLDPAVLVLVCAGILGVTTLVSLKPAFDAGRTDLTTLLKDE
jgi:putative ABC transport system permease protein